MIIEGIKYDELSDSFVFDFKQDESDDLIQLKFKSFNKKLSTKRGVPVYIAYKFNLKDATLRNAIKFVDRSKLQKSDLDLMIKKSIMSFNALFPLNSFDLIITPKSSSPLLNYIAGLMKEKAGTNTFLANDLIIKNSIENVRLDLKKIKPEFRDGIQKMMERSTVDGHISLKKLPPRFRNFVENIFTFDKEIDRKIFNKISGGNILIVDDIVTTGTTLKQMNNLVDSFLPESVVSFVFLSEQSK